MLSVFQGPKRRHPGLSGGGAARSLAELLPWLCLYGEALVLCKDGSLLACFEVTGPDADSLDAAAAADLAESMEQALRNLDERCTVWSVFERRRSLTYLDGVFPNPVAARIDRLHAARFRSGQQFENRHVLSLLFTPSSGDFGWRQVLALLRGGRGSGSALRWWHCLDRDQHAQQRWEGLAREREVCEAMLEGFCGSLPGVVLRRLEGAELLGFLNACASPSHAAVPVQPPGESLFLDALLGEDHLSVGASQLRFTGGGSVRTLAALGIKAWPDSTVPGLIEALLRVPVEMTVVQVFRVVAPETAKNHIQSVRRFHLNLQRSAFSFVREAVFGEAGQVHDDTREVAAQEARAALAGLASQRQVYGWFNLTVLVACGPGEDLDAALRCCAAAVREAGFLVLREGVHLLSAWSGSLPGQWGQLVRWHFVHTGNLADLLPLQSAGRGERCNPHLGEQLGSPCAAMACLPGLDRTTYHFNFHCGDLGHCVVLGPSRSGKSVLMNFLLAQFLRYPRARVLILDKDRSCRIPTVLQGGLWLDPGSPGNTPINPLTELATPEGRLWLRAWLSRLLGGPSRHWSAQDEQALDAALDGLDLLPPAQQCLASLQVLLPAHLAAQLEVWVGAGRLAHLFDGNREGLGLDRITCIELGALLREGEIARLYTDYILRRIDALLSEVPLAPTVIYVEEAWFLLDQPLFRDRIREWLKTLPKRLALVVLATQSLDDLADSPVFSAIADNVPTRIFLANRNAGAQSRLYQEQFGLNPAQVQKIARAQAKRQFLVVKPNESRFVDLALPAEIVNLLRSDRHAQEVFDRCLVHGGSDLAERYLNALHGEAHE